MCLATVAKIKKIIDINTAVADFGGITAEIKTNLLNGLSVNDYVLIHAGFAINKISKEDAMEIIKASSESGFI